MSDSYEYVRKEEPSLDQQGLDLPSFAPKTAPDMPETAPLDIQLTLSREAEPNEPNKPDEFNELNEPDRPDSLEKPGEPGEPGDSIQPIQSIRPDETSLPDPPGEQRPDEAPIPADREDALPEPAPEEAPIPIEETESTGSPGPAEGVIPRNYYRDSTYTVVSLVSYLLGVPKRIFENEHEPPKLEFYKQLDLDKNARIVRNLCMLRTAIERNFGQINDQITHNYKVRLMSMMYWFSFCRLERIIWIPSSASCMMHC